MYCKYCGAEIKKEANFCEYCGRETDKSLKEKEEVDADTGPYKAFAVIGYAYGFASLAFCWCPGMVLAMIPGIVLSCLGLNSKNEEKRKKAATGRKLNIIATAINAFVTIAFIIVWFAFVIHEINKF